MSASEFLKRKLGSDLSPALGRKVMSLMEEYAEEMKVKLISTGGYALNTEVGEIVEVIKIENGLYYCSVISCGGTKQSLAFPSSCVEEIHTDQHYDNTNGSLYKFAQDHGLNAWEFDIIKRVVRCRKKGQFKEDLEKTKRVIDIYLKEYESMD